MVPVARFSEAFHVTFAISDVCVRACDGTAGSNSQTVSVIIVALCNIALLFTLPILVTIIKRTDRTVSIIVVTGLIVALEVANFIIEHLSEAPRCTGIRSSAIQAIEIAVFKETLIVALAVVNHVFLAIGRTIIVQQAVALVPFTRSSVALIIAEAIRQPLQEAAFSTRGLYTVSSIPQASFSIAFSLALSIHHHAQMALPCTAILAVASVPVACLVVTLHVTMAVADP